jgi:hypothetical protein
MACYRDSFIFYLLYIQWLNVLYIGTYCIRYGIKEFIMGGIKVNVIINENFIALYNKHKLWQSFKQ